MVSVLAGIVVIVGGVLKLGRVVGYIPWPVIEGFTLGIAVIIFLQQVPAALGARSGASTNAAIAAVQSLGGLRWPQTLWSLLVVAVVAAIMVVAARVHRQIPGSIIAVIVVTLVRDDRPPSAQPDRRAAADPSGTGAAEHRLVGPARLGRPGIDGRGPGGHRVVAVRASGGIPRRHRRIPGRP